MSGLATPLRDQMSSGDRRRPQGRHRHSDRSFGQRVESLTAKRGAALWLGIFGGMLALGLWQLVTWIGVVSAQDVPPAADVLSRLAIDATTTQFWHDIANTMEQWGIGMALSVAIAIPLGLAMGSVEAFWRALRPIVEFLRPVPGVALIPLAILIWGLSLTSSVFLIVNGCAWSLIVQTMYGARSVDAATYDTARVFGLTRIQRIRYVVLPTALPYIATGLRLASATALIVAISAELLIGLPGLGHDIALTQSGGQVTEMYALIVASGLVGVAVHTAFTRVESRVLRWHPSHRQIAA